MKAKVNSIGSRPYRRRVLGHSWRLLWSCIFFWSQISADGERGSGADLFYCGVALFDADRELGLLRGGRIGAD